MQYTVIVVDGDVCDLCEPYTGSVCFEGLDGEERDLLLRLALERGMDAVVRPWEGEKKQAEEESA